METLDTIFTRRSIRKYQNKEVPKELVEKILKAAMSAPSARNEQPWHFLVITDKKILKQIPEIHPHAAMAREAQLAILVCGDLNLQTATDGFWQEDCSAAVQNLLLAVTDLGLGAVWTGIYPNQERVQNFKQFFNLPQNIIPFALIPIGYPAEKPKAKDNFRQDRIHYNHW